MQVGNSHFRKVMQSRGEKAGKHDDEKEDVEEGTPQ